MATAEEDGLVAACAEGEDELAEPFMPHRVFGKDDVARRYPSLKVPEEVDGPDIDDDAENTIYQSGLRGAGGIDDAMRRFGRTRKHARSRAGTRVAEK